MSESIEVSCEYCGQRFLAQVRFRRKGQARFCTRRCSGRANPRRTRTCEQAMADFWKQVQKAAGDECWLWTGALKSTGYGHFGWAGRTRLAHRFSLELATGTPAPGMDALHSCHNPKCVNPQHLRWGTHQENMQDRNARRGWVRGTRKLAERLARSDGKAAPKIHAVRE